jgi:hypothetical protein
MMKVGYDYIVANVLHNSKNSTLLLQHSIFLVQYSLLFSSFFLNKKMWVHGRYITICNANVKNCIACLSICNASVRICIAYLIVCIAFVFLLEKIPFINNPIDFFSSFCDCDLFGEQQQNDND